MDDLLLGGDSKGPIWKRLVRNVIRMVDQGEMPDGSRLPPSRVLARDLHVNRSTVCRAYEELASLGYLESRSGSYTTVRARAHLAPQSRAAKSLLDWDAVSSPTCAEMYRDAVALPRVVTPQEGWIDFGTLAADPSLSPTTEFAQVVRRLLADDVRRTGRTGRAPTSGRAGTSRQGPPGTLLDYGDPAGHPALRETLAHRMLAHGIRATADEVLVTQGAQQALDLVFRLVARPGASVIVEAPTYGLVLPLARLHGLRPIEIPMRAEGMDLDVLEKALAKERPSLLYTIPTFHNPTGVTTSQAHRERLLRLCERHAVPILEDGYEEEMKYLGRRVLPIKSMDSRGMVIYVGTFSKVLFPGLRVGWITADRECLRRLMMLTRVTSLSGSVLPQAAIERFCHEGRYDKYLRRVHARFRQRMTALLDGLQRHLAPTPAEWSQPNGGCTAWVTVPGVPADDEKRLAELSIRSRVIVTPGSLFHATPPDTLSFRLSISKVRLLEVEEGCRRVAKLVKDLTSAPRLRLEV